MDEKLNKAIYGSPDRPLKIGNAEIPCYVLEDGRRVLVQGGMITALGIARGSRDGRGDRIANLTAGKRLKPFISAEIYDATQNPIKFRLPNGNNAYAYEATLLPSVCDAILEARDKKALQPQQQPLAKQCEILIRGLATVGIIALVDEATGYQEIRDKAALQVILDTYLTDEYAKWSKTFPDEFYKQLFKLKNMPYPPATRNKPSYIGHWTNNIVYSRLAPGIVAKLKEMNPRQASGNRGHAHHQHMTQDYGSPELKSHLDKLIFLMKGCTTWVDFERKLNRASPKYGDTISIDFPGGDEGDG